MAAGMAVRGWFLFHTLRPLGTENDQFASVYLERIYYPTYSRLDGLLAGVSLALLRTLRPEWWAMVERRGHTLFACGLGLVAFCAWLFADRFSSATGASAWSTVVGFPLLALGLGLVVASAISENGLLSRIPVPGARPIAMMAFSIYLTHKEVMHFDDRLFPGVLEGPQLRALAFCFATCIAVGAALYWAVEQPFLMLRDRKLKGARVEEAHAVHS
jgi:peptidoglycan/LPS O-acetylase OafA/YrhL